VVPLVATVGASQPPSCEVLVGVGPRVQLLFPGEVARVCEQWRLLAAPTGEFATRQLSGLRARVGSPDVWSMSLGHLAAVSESGAALPSVENMYVYILGSGYLRGTRLRELGDHSGDGVLSSGDGYTGYVFVVACYGERADLGQMRATVGRNIGLSSGFLAVQDRDHECGLDIIDDGRLVPLVSGDGVVCDTVYASVVAVGKVAEVRVAVEVDSHVLVVSADFFQVDGFEFTPIVYDYGATHAVLLTEPGEYVLRLASADIGVCYGVVAMPIISIGANITAKLLHSCGGLVGAAVQSESAVWAYLNRSNERYLESLPMVAGGEALVDVIRVHTSEWRPFSYLGLFETNAVLSVSRLGECVTVDGLRKYVNGHSEELLVCGSSVRCSVTVSVVKGELVVAPWPFLGCIDGLRKCLLESDVAGFYGGVDGDCVVEGGETFTMLL